VVKGFEPLTFRGSLKPNEVEEKKWGRGGEVSEKEKKSEIKGTAQFTGSIPSGSEEGGGGGFFGKGKQYGRKSATAETVFNPRTSNERGGPSS